MTFLSDQITQLKTSADNFVNKQTGVVQAQAASSNSLPWKSPKIPVKSVYWGSIQIDPNRWNQLFPYRFVVIDTKDNKIVGGSSSTSNTKISQNEGNTIINFEPMGQKWIFRLPITPQALSIVDQYAIQNSATLRGVLEEHNGAKFKMVTLSGTFGVWPSRPSVTTPPGSPSVLQSLFGGTIESATNFVGQVSKTLNAASGHPANKPKTLKPKETDQGATSTGYYQALALQQFIEQYAEAKKNPNNATWRLVFDIPKQNQSFVVTPMMFNWLQNENNPTRINYNIQLKAWRRIDLSEKASAVVPSIQQLDASILQRILNTISEARKLMSSAISLIGAVRSDVERPLDVLRQSALFVKDLAGVVTTAADLPFQIQRDYASSIKESLRILSSSISGSSSDPKVRASVAAIVASSVLVEGLSLASVSNGQLGKQAATAQTIDPSNNVFRNPEANFTLMDSVPVFNLSLSFAQQNAVDQAIEQARTTTVDDLKTYRAVIQDLSLQLSNVFGAGDPFFAQIYGRPVPATRISPMTLDEFELLKALYDVMQSYDILTATTQIDDSQKQTNMEYVAGLADQAGIEFNISNSKILAPVPFGLTIEQIAARYLGDPQRWLEIVTLNNLRDPYIDENGFQRTLLSNASGRQITISSVADMYIGQRVVLKSSTQSPSARRILGIDRLSDTSYLLSLDGEPNLDNFIVFDKAYLQAYLPGTVNSQQKIFIPSDLELPQEPNILVPTSVASDPLVGLSKVDWLLTDTGDLAVNSFGDLRYAAGITNIVQALKLKIATPKGSMLMHPDYGLGIRAGIMSSDVNVQDIYNNINKLIEEDPRFQGLDSLQISLNGPTLTISMGVVLAGQNGVFPLTFELPV
jgi:hypothetical protein